MGEIKDIKKEKFYISCNFLNEVKLGQSISHDGVCLTVSNIFKDLYEIELMPETFRKSHFKEKKVGDLVNLERAMKINGRFDGHIVQGHCDLVGEIQSIKNDGNSFIFKIKIPPEYSKYFVEKGSVTLNGISLTIIEVGDSYFTVGIIPHTWEITNLQYLKTKSLVNIETDILAKYFVKLIR